MCPATLDCNFLTFLWAFIIAVCSDLNTRLSPLLLAYFCSILKVLLNSISPEILLQSFLLSNTEGHTSATSWYFVQFSLPNLYYLTLLLKSNCFLIFSRSSKIWTTVYFHMTLKHRTFLNFSKQLKKSEENYYFRTHKNFMQYTFQCL